MENTFLNKTFRNLINIFILVLIITIPVLAFNLGIDKEKDNLISVTGFAEIYAKPDVAHIVLTVVSENKSLKLATEDNNTKGNAIIAFLKENNIEDSCLLYTSGLAIAEKFLKEGAKVVFSDINKEKGEEIVLNKENAVFIKCDVSDSKEVSLSLIHI